MSQIASFGSAEISEQELRQKFTEHVDTEHIPVILQLLQHFELCHRVKDKGTFEFPCYISSPLKPELWSRESRFAAYSGRQLECTDDTDSFPPGFICRLQVQVSEYFKQEEPTHFKGGFIVDAKYYQCLVTINNQSTAVALIGRTEKGHGNSCLRLLDHIQNMIAVLTRDMCPTIFLDLKILSSIDLIQHQPRPHKYGIRMVNSALFNYQLVRNSETGSGESPTDLLFLGDDDLRESNKGLRMKVSYIPEEIIAKVQELLQDGEKVW